MKRKANPPSKARVEREMQKLGKNLDQLIARTREAEAAARIKYAGQLRMLKAKQETARKTLAQIRRRSAAASGPLKAGVVKAWADLTAAVSKARQRFRETS